jgi:hypothetical protein
VPYNSQMNGFVERKNMTNCEATRAMITIFRCLFGPMLLVLLSIFRTRVFIKPWKR